MALPLDFLLPTKGRSPFLWIPTPDVWGSLFVVLLTISFESLKLLGYPFLSVLFLAMG